MPFHKLTVEFSSTAKTQNAQGTTGNANGWTESWYHGFDRTDDEMLTIARKFVEARRTILTYGWSTIAYRISQLNPDLTPNRKGRLVFVPPDDQPGKIVTGGDEQPYDGLVIAVATTLSHRRPFIMRGIPGNIVNAGTRYIGSAGFTTAIQDFASWITGAVNFDKANIGMTLKVRLDPQTCSIANIGIPTPPLNGADARHPSVQIHCEAVPPVAPQVGMFIAIRSVGTMPHMHGTWKISKVTPLADPADFVLLLHSKRRVTVTGVYAGGGDGRFWGYNLEGVASFIPGYGTSRRTGRPPQLARGRRSRGE